MTTADNPPANPDAATADADAAIAGALAVLDANNPHSTDGRWLEDLTAAVAPQLKEWDLSHCYRWSDWPERETRFPGTTQQDIGIDAVAVSRSDGGHIAIQCKARQLDAAGRGADITKSELDKFAAASANPFWTQRWLVTNGDNSPSNNTAQVISTYDPERPIKIFNIHADLIAARHAAAPPEPCPHCDPAAAPDPDGAAPRRTRQCMQDEAVAESVRILREHAQSDSGGLPVGQARGKIILPCGTGKTRISLRIVERLTPPGAIAIVLCPSIALVAQIRREYLQHAAAGLRALAVCSDETAGYDPKKESSRNTAADPTLDNSNVSAAEVKGKVTTNPAEIARWIQQGQGAGPISVIFGTYQSGQRIAAALRQTGVTAQVLVADEAHRTAGLRRVRQSAANDKRRDFTLCHDNDAFPAKYRVYQTATPRIYDTRKVAPERSGDWIVRTMDDETVFGVELYRKSYMEAVHHRWLADYRIIAVAVNGPDAFRVANDLAANTQSRGGNKLTTTHFLRGLAFTLAMGGATRNAAARNGGADGNDGAARIDGDATLPIKSCIAFMNTVDHSKNMAQELQTPAVRDWLQDWLRQDGKGQSAAPYTLEHLDATSNVTARENAKRRLAEAADAHPHGIINVGIFGEGTDSPSLSAVAFLEARKSPIDVIQAVGRAMRTAPGKEYGYIICPIQIPPSANPETWLQSSDMAEGWQELGQILLALRAHDQRIEDNLAGLLQLYIPPDPEITGSVIGIAAGEEQRISYRQHTGKPGEAQQAVARVLAGESALAAEFQPIIETGRPETANSPAAAAAGPALTLQYPKPETGDTAAPRQIGDGKPAPAAPPEPTQIITGKKNPDGTTELRLDTVVREKSGPDDAPGKVDFKKTKAKARNMINKGEGVRISADPPPRPPRRTREEVAQQSALRLLELTGMADNGSAISMNLLAKSGLTGNRVARDLNLLETGVNEAAHHLRADELQPALDQHFGLDNLKSDKRREQADGCTIAALLLMNAAMLHQRIANGQWLPGIGSLDAVKHRPNVVNALTRQWNAIIGHDFKPILEPAVNVVYAVEDTGKTAGLERALRHIAAEAGRIAETYADMGADHAGPLFNRVMGNQASDGAFFTRPVAAAIAARLTLDACGGPDADGGPDWTNPQVWQDHKTVDLACGSGTLLAAILADLKRRAAAQGATDADIPQLQKIAVEDTLKGLDINPVSLQLAASQLTAGNYDIRYRKMGLHLMPYGPQTHNPAQVSAGTLELLGQQAIVARRGVMDLGDDQIASRTVWQQPANADLDDPIDAAQNARIVIMNPPFTNRTKMGEKFPSETKQALRKRVDALEQMLVNNDQDLADFVDKNSLAPLFVALAEKCTPENNGILTMINPTIAVSNPSGLAERRILAQRYHIHTVLTCHQPGNVNMSQNTGINESIIVAVRHNGAKPPTRFINLDRMPADDAEVSELHQCINDCDQGSIANGWGEISHWPAERIAAGDWTPAVWRSPELAEAAAGFANDNSLKTLAASALSPAATGQMLRGSFEPAAYAQQPGSFPILKSKSAESQTRIQSQPDEWWIHKNYDASIAQANGGEHPATAKIRDKAGHLLITAGQNSSTGRLTATADDEMYVGNGWMPVDGLSAAEAKALAVFINSTPGRLQLMQNPGGTLIFPTYSTAEAAKIRIPDIKDARIRQTLADCYEQTKDRPVPQYRDGECEVRRRWDEAAAQALSCDPAELTRLRQLLHQEPHVRGLGYGQHADAAE